MSFDRTRAIAQLHEFTAEMEDQLRRAEETLIRLELHPQTPADILASRRDVVEIKKKGLAALQAQRAAIEQAPD